MRTRHKGRQTEEIIARQIERKKRCRERERERKKERD
jgi:hypothetical protein